MTANPLLLVVCAAFVTLLVGPAVWSRRAANRRSDELLAFAEATGWHEPTGALPLEVATAAGSPRSRLLKQIDHDGFVVWVSWHQWSQPTGHRSIPTTYHLTRYFVRLPRQYPRATVRPRGRWARGPMAGTGDPAFDRAFTVSPVDEPATLTVLTAEVRDALRAGQIGPFHVAGALLVLSSHRAPTVDTLNRPLDEAVATARLLPA